MSYIDTIIIILTIISIILVLNMVCIEFMLAKISNKMENVLNDLSVLHKDIYDETDKMCKIIDRLESIKYSIDKIPYLG